MLSSCLLVAMNIKSFLEKIIDSLLDYGITGLQYLIYAKQGIINKYKVMNIGRVTNSATPCFAREIVKMADKFQEHFCAKIGDKGKEFVKFQFKRRKRMWIKYCRSKGWPCPQIEYQNSGNHSHR